ncbi:hypothetical protein P3T35_001544 [Kitasatospora sp. GP30]|nr:hypothetical protein [Kitasatospora sp. GP30]
MTTTAPTTVNGRVIALAHNAARALLEGVLTRHGATFHQSVTLPSSWSRAGPSAAMSSSPTSPAR